MKEPGVNAISVVIADQRKTCRVSYSRRFRLELGIKVVAEASSGYEVVKSLKLRPQILLLDWNLSAMYGLSLLPLVRRRSPQTQVILVVDRATQVRMLTALSLGARGYIRRAAVPGFLAKAVRVVDQGEAWVPRAIVPPLLNTMSRTGWQ